MFLTLRICKAFPAEVFTMHSRQSCIDPLKSLASSALAIFAVVSLAVPVLAQQSRTSMQSNTSSTYGDSTVHNVLQSALSRPGGANQLDKTMPGGKINYGDHGETGKSAPRLTNPGTIWPEITPPFPTMADERTASTFNEIARVTGVNNPTFGAMPATAMGVGLTMAAATQLQADYEADPQNSIDRAKEEQNQANQTTADTNAQMERNQAGSAIDFCASYLYNFTVEANNKWNVVRNQLFLPMALLLLLPGVVLAQLKATVSAGTPVINDITSPFDGILRAIVGIFLIPGTYLFINYGIDVSNAITFTIQDQYYKIFKTDMYKDAMCAHIRAFPYRNQKENLGHITNQEANMDTALSGRALGDKDAFAKFETKNLEVALRDPCAKLNKAPKDRSNELVPYVVNAQRNSYNTGNAALAMTWNVLCAFQMAYLYYLWFVGPVIAALWVYPMKELRDAFPAWINGVCTICFWSLFWNTTVLLMACCRGVDETGTLIMSALNFLSTACVKFAFDFSGLVREAGMQAAQQAQKGGAGASGGKGGQGAQGASGKSHHTHSPGHNPSVPSYATRAANAMPTNSTAPTGGSGDRTVSSPSPFSLDSGTGAKPGDGGRSLLGGKQDGGAVGLDSFTFVPPPTGSGQGGARSLADHANLLNSQGSPLSMKDVAAFTGNGPGGSNGSGSGSGTGDGVTMGDDVDFNSITLDSATMVGGAAGLATGATGHGMPHIDAGGLHHTHGGHGAGGGIGDISHAHNHAMHLSQSDMQNLFMSGGQAAGVRDQLMQQMNMPGGPGGVFVDGANGASAFVSSQQLSQAFDAADAAGGDTNINVANLLGSQGVDLPAANFSGLNMSPIAATAMGGANGFVPPGSDPNMSRASMDASALASASGIPLTNGVGGASNGVVPPDVVNAQRQATLDRISNEVQSSMSSIQAQNQARAEQQVQAANQAQFAQLSAQQGGTMSAVLGSSGTGGFGQGIGGSGDPTQGQGVTSGSDLQRQALGGMAEIYRNSADIVTGTGGSGTISASQLGNIDPGTTAGSYSAASLNPGANVSGVAQTGTAGNPGSLPTNVPQPTNLASNVDANGNQVGGAQRPNAGEYLKEQAYQAWKGENGFENRMINASISDQTLARGSVNDSLNRGTLQDRVQGTASSVPQNIDNSGATNTPNAANTAGYSAASPTSYAQASYTPSAAGGGTGSGVTSGGTAGGAQPMDPLSKESLNNLAKQLDVTPEVRSMSGRSEVASGGLGTTSGGLGTTSGSGYTDSGTVGYAQSSAANQNVTGYTSASNATASGGSSSSPSAEPRLPQQPASPDGGSGFVANAPRGDAGAGQPQQFDKSAYMSQQLGEQWKQYDQKVDNAIAADYKQQINGAVESTYSRASSSAQDNMTGQASNLPTQQQPSSGNGGSNPTFMADGGGTNGGMNYQAPAPASGNTLARESSPAPAENHPGAVHQSGATQHAAHTPSNEAIRQQIDQLADAINYTPEVNLGRHSQHVSAGGDAGVPNGVPGQGLQYFAQQSYTSSPDAMQGMNRQSQLPTNYQGQNNNAAQSGVNSPTSVPVPVPMQWRYGNVSSSRADALKNATRAKESYRGDTDKSGAESTGSGGTSIGGKTNKLSNALGKAASVNAAKKAAASAAAGAKAMKDPMGSVATGSTLRRLRNKRKWSQEEIEAMGKLSGGADPDWEM